MVEYYKRTTSDKELHKVYEPGYGTWVNVVDPSEREINELSSKLSVPREFLTYSLDTNEKPRIEKENGVIMIIFRLPIKMVNDINENKKFEKIETIPLGIILTNKVFITVSLQQNDIIDDFAYKLKNFFTSMKTRFLLLILHRINFHYNTLLDLIEIEIEAAEKGMESSIKNRDIIKFFGLKKTLIYFNTSVVANNNVLKKILGGKIVKLYEEDEDLLEDIIIENNQAIEMVAVYRNILSGTLDTYSSIVSNNLTLIMKTLAIITIFLALPTMVTSFYGMNVTLPLQGNPLAYIYIFGMFIVLACLLYFIFKFARWL